MPGRIAKYIAFLGVFLFAVLLSQTLYATITIKAIDVGQGDCVLIQSNTHNVLIDAGWGYDDVADYLADKDIFHIHKVIGTHGHADHIGGLVGVLQRKDVDTVIYNGQTHTTNTFEKFIDAIAESDAAYHEPSRGESFELGEMTLEILHPEGSAADYEGHLHDKNIVVRIVYGEFAAIISGDIEREGELDILNSGVEVSAKVLVAWAPWLQNLQPPEVDSGSRP